MSSNGEQENGQVMLHDDCCDLTMYPLQMVLQPLIGQHVGTSQASSTIGKLFKDNRQTTIALMNS